MSKTSKKRLKFKTSAPFINLAHPTFIILGRGPDEAWLRWFSANFLTSSCEVWTFPEIYCLWTVFIALQTSVYCRFLQCFTLRCLCPPQVAVTCLRLALLISFSRERKVSPGQWNQPSSAGALLSNMALLGSAQMLPAQDQDPRKTKVVSSVRPPSMKSLSELSTRQWS